MKAYRRYLSRGDWAPARFTHIDLFVVVVFLIVLAVVRATDYVTGTDSTLSFGALERAFPLVIWAIVLYAGAACLLFGAVFRRHFAVWFGHGILWITYLAIFAGLATTLSFLPDYDGVRFVGPVFLVSALHFIFWIRTGPVPLKEEDSSQTESISGPY